MLIREDIHDDVLAKAKDPAYLSSLSDNELKKFWQDTNELRYFFGLMEQTSKELANSCYGGFGTASLRYFNQAVAEDITAEGRHACQYMETVSRGYFKKIWPTDTEWHNELRTKFPDIMRDVTPLSIFKDDVIVYCDTDSNYLTFDLIFESLGLNPKTVPTKLATDFIVYFMQKKLDPIYDTVLTNMIAKRNGKSTMKFELESVGGFGIFAAKKKYVYAKLWHNGKYIADQKGLNSTGIELAQNSTPMIARKAIKTFINKIFAQKGAISSREFFSMCNALKTKIATVEPALFSKNTRINKYEKYVVSHEEKIELRSRCPFTVRGAANYNHLIWKSGLQAKYPYLKNGSRAKTYYDISGKPFSFPNDSEFPHEIAPEMSIDIQLEKLIFNPVKRLISGGMIDGDISKLGSDKVTQGFGSMFKKH